MMQKTFVIVLYVYLFAFLLSTISLTLAQEESESSKRMAEMMAQNIDKIWDQEPEEGTANIRILMLKDGEPYAGEVSIHTDFSFRAISRSHHSQGFNPNSNGRWIYTDLEPGTYKLEIEGFNDFEGWSWEKEGVKVDAGDAPLFEISLDPISKETE